MKKTKLLILSAVLGAMIFSSEGFAQLDKTAQTGMKWLSIPIGARAAALGNAYTAGSPDASSVFWNPAGLAAVKGTQVFINQTQWIADIWVQGASATYDMESLGVVGIHWMNVSWGTFNGTEFVNNSSLYRETGAFEPKDYAFGVSYARQISDKFSVGGNIRYLYEDLIGGAQGSFANPTKYNAVLEAFGFDIGTLFYTGYKDLRLGMTAQNISAEQKYKYESFPLPLTFKFGLSMDIAKAYFLEENSVHSVTLLVDAIHPRDHSERMHFGVEYAFDEMAFLRGGYKTNYDEENISFGVGALVDISGYNLGVDYSFVNFTNFDPVQIFSFNVGF